MEIDTPLGLVDTKDLWLLWVELSDKTLEPFFLDALPMLEQRCRFVINGTNYELTAGLLQELLTPYRIEGARDANVT